MKVQYVTIAEARRELEARNALRIQVRRFLNNQGCGLAPLPNASNLAVFARHVITARREDRVFQNLALRGGLTPCWVSYVQDTYDSRSKFKRSLICPRTETRGTLRGYKLRPVNPPQGRTLSEIETRRGGNLVGWHKQRHHALFGSTLTEDWSNWYQSQGGRARLYYKNMLMMFIAHGVLFEDYDGGESGDELSDFHDRVFAPAYQAVCETFGVAPLIVQMPWEENFAHYLEV